MTLSRNVIGPLAKGDGLRAPEEELERREFCFHGGRRDWKVGVEELSGETGNERARAVEE